MKKCSLKNLDSVVKGESMQRRRCIKKYEDSIHVRFPYVPDYIFKNKTIKGYRWHLDNKCWSLFYSELINHLTVFDNEKVEGDNALKFRESDGKNG